MKDTLKTAFIVVVTMATTSVTLPLGAHAAGQLMTIVDSDSASKAQVDDGSLRIGDGNGALTTNGSARIEPRGAPKHVWLTARANDGSDYFANAPSYTVPAGRRFLVTRISGYAAVPASQAIHLLSLNANHGQLIDAVVHIAPDNHVDQPETRWFTYEENTMFTVRSGRELYVHAFRTGNSGSANVELHVMGYLIED